MHPLRKLRETGPSTAAQYRGLLAENVVFHSPVFVRAVHGLKEVAAIFAASPSTATAAIREYKQLPYDTVMPGHGLPGGRELYDEMLSYLAFSEVALANAVDGEDLKERLIRKFPNYGGLALLDHQKRFLFKSAH